MVGKLPIPLLSRSCCSISSSISSVMLGPRVCTIVVVATAKNDHLTVQQCRMNAAYVVRQTIDVLLRAMHFDENGIVRWER